MSVNLSPREHQVLLCIWNGLSGKEIAMHQGISVTNAKNAAERIRLKFGVSNKVLVVRRALELGIIQLTKEAP